jgi:hypothetical protein
MPWRGPQYEGEFPSLGWQVGEWIETHCVIPDGDAQGDPYLLTDEMWQFLVRFYRLRDDGRGFDESCQRGGQLVRPQKWGKGPFSAAIVCAEADGPVRPDGFDAAGEPVGRQWSTPWVQITAVSGDQTDNVWRSLVPMIELGDLKADIPDTGITRINLRGSGYIEPVTSSARSRLGQRITFSVQDETHSWVARNGGHQLADNQRRNLAGMGGRFLETTNAWDPAEDSVAQRTSSAPSGVVVDFPPTPPGSVRNKADRRKILRKLYGQCWWIDIDRIDAEIVALVEHDPAQAERFFLNRVHAGESVAFDLERWTAQQATQPEGRRFVTLGVDGARFDDAVAVVACDIETGHLWPVKIITRPELAGDDYEHDMAALDGAVREVFADHDVWRMYIDPQWIETYVAAWQNAFGADRVHEWYTNRPRQTCFIVRQFAEAIAAGDLTHDGDSVLSEHVANARRRKETVRDSEGRPMWTIQKDRPGSPAKIDAAMAALLAWEARSDAIASGATKPKRRRVASF